MGLQAWARVDSKASVIEIIEDRGFWICARSVPSQLIAL